MGFTYRCKLSCYPPMRSFAIAQGDRLGINISALRIVC